MTSTIRIQSSASQVDKYRRSGRAALIEGRWVVVTRYSRSEDDHGLYTHTMEVRAAAEAEEKAGKIAALQHSIHVLGSHGPDDERDRDAHTARFAALDDELRALEGRPSRAEEAAAAAAKVPAMLEHARAQLAIPRDAKMVDEDGDEKEARDWFAVTAAIWAGRARSTSINDLKRMSDEEIAQILG